MPVRWYAAFLRGVSPSIIKMPDLVRGFEAAGFSDVKTVLTSGNVVFRANAASDRVLEQRAERAMNKTLGRSFFTIVRSIDALRAMLEAEPHARFGARPGTKRVVTFLRDPPARKPKLPLAKDGASILGETGAEFFSEYVPGPRGPVFMELLEKTLGDEITTRTWDTVKKVVAATSTPARTFETRIVRESGLCFLPVPFDPTEVFGKVRAPVKVTLGSYTYRSTIASMGNGPCLPLRKSHRDAAGLGEVKDGQKVRVRLELDVAPREVTPPRDLERALKRESGVWERWAALSYTHRREWVEAVESAKKPETRERRIANAVRAMKGE